MYFKFFKLHSWGKRSASNRRRFIQRLLKQLVGNAVPGVPSEKFDLDGQISPLSPPVPNCRLAAAGTPGTAFPTVR